LEIEKPRNRASVPVLQTPRLQLRPFIPDDAERVHQIESNWNVARMLRLAAYPPDVDDIRGWLETHASERDAGTAFRFAAVFDGEVIGCADVADVSEGSGAFGYWFDERYWGRGLATEAAEALLRFCLDELELTRLISGHAEDNPASGRILTKLGFRETGRGEVWSEPRRGMIRQIWYEFRPG
jgi:[ribosomal protein S5]-alanine N-acetyltransferase